MNTLSRENVISSVVEKSVFQKILVIADPSAPVGMTTHRGDFL